MKISNLYIICITLLALAQSCTKMNDLHQKYLDKGEIVYAAKVDSVTPGPGKNRIQLEISIVSQRIETVRIFWNDYKDSVDVAIGSKTGVFKKLLTNMAEKSYIFQLVSLDKYGNKSLPFEVAGNVYGDSYRASLTARTSHGFDYDGVKLDALWSTADALERGTSIQYTTISSGVQTLFLSRDSSKITLVDRKPGTPFSFQSVYVPEKASIDTFHTAWTTLPVNYLAKVSKAGWSITGFDSQEPSEAWWSSYDYCGMAKAVIDDILSTFWHSQWNGGQPGYPHWFSIDMGTEVSIASIEVFRRQGHSDGQTKHQFLYSDDGITWTDYGTFGMDVNTDAGQKFSCLTIPSIPTARYIKYVALEGPNFYAFLAEINVYIPMQ